MTNYYYAGLFFCWVALSWASLSSKEKLSSSLKAFDRGQYQEALKLIEDVDIRRDLDDSDDMKMAFKVRAIAYAEIGDKTHAKATIRELFFLDQDYRFDPFETPAMVVELAKEERQIFEDKNKKLALLQDVSPSTQRSLDTKTAFFPLGLNHYYLNSPWKGGIYLSVQALGLITNIAAFWWKQSYVNSFGSHHLKESEFRAGFNTAQAIQYIGLGTLLTGFLVSMIDALIQIKGSNF